jgi:protein-lysine N-methyltransferase EEF2KMT
MTLLATLPHSRPAVDLSKTLVSYVPPVGYEEDVSPIEILEAKKIIGSGPNTGLRTWEAALHLAQYLYSRRELIHNRKVLELGAGTGFLSIFCAAYLQPQMITTTDGHEEVLASLRDNVHHNAHMYAPHHTPIVQKMFWGDMDDIHRITGGGVEGEHGKERRLNEPTEHSRQQINTPYDVIIGADISYDPEACKSLAKTLSELAKANPYTDILISATQRNIQTLSGFIDECQGRGCGLRVEVVDFMVPSFGDQTGLFHNVVSPIQIFTMWYAPPEIS